MNDRILQGVGTVLGRIWVWSLLLVLSCAAMVWFLGPLLAVDDHRIWAGATARLVTISGVFLLWGLAMAFVGPGFAAWRQRPEREVRRQPMTGWRTNAGTCAVGSRKPCTCSRYPAIMESVTRVGVMSCPGTC